MKSRLFQLIAHMSKRGADSSVSSNVNERRSYAEAKKLRPGGPHYTAYVGPPTQYDVMGAMQFRLLTTIGLREHHRLLDFGCGSLRAGRLFIPYLNPGCYTGLEPNRWLIEQAIGDQIGHDLVRIKKPRFLYRDDFGAVGLDGPYDFILAQSIFSHAGRDLIEIALNAFRAALAPGGIIAATFIHLRPNKPDDEFQGTGWIYPGCVRFHPQTIMRFIEEAQLAGVPISWYHPRQTWYLMAREPSVLPPQEHMRHLTGAILRDSEFAESWR